jgi:hypothetical protein
MRIDQSGNVGIGTASPALTLQVQGVIGLTTAYVETPSKLYQSNGNGILQLQSHNGINQEYPVQIGVPDNSGALAFYTSASVTPPTAPVFTERMRITNVGNVSIASLAGTGTRMVTADPSGVFGTQAIPAGGPTSFSKPARTNGTPYQNTSGKPIYIVIAVYLNGGTATQTVQAFCDATTNPTTEVAQFYLTGATSTLLMTQTLSFIVLPGYWYKVSWTPTTLALQDWCEWN